MEKTIPSALQRAVQENGDKVFLYEGEKSLTFRQLDEITDRFAHSLLKQGLKKGDHIGLLALNQMEWLISFFAATKIGVGIVALSPRFRETELTYMLNHSEAKAVISIGEFGDYSFADAFESLQDKLETVETYIFLGEGFDGSLSFQQMLDQPVHSKELSRQKQMVEKDDLSIMIYTSGTTGKPKGVMITHESILASAQAQADHFSVTEKDVAVGSLPFNHVGGITCTVMVALLTHSSITLVPFFHPQQVLTAIETFKATILGAVPTMYLMLFSTDNIEKGNLDSLRLAIVGGSNVEAALAEKINQVMPNASLVNLYGLSESSGACVLSKLTDDVEKVKASIGVPIGNFKTKVVDQEGKSLKIGEEGELAIKGACVAKGYYRDEDKTKEAFTDDGWLYTGDIVSQDEAGYLSFKGRVQEMFIQGGFNVYPIEIENVLTSHKAVQMAAGIGVPDDFLGEIGRYYIVKTPGVKVTADELLEHCEKYLADYKVPRQIVFKEELPMTPAGKIQKSLLKAEYLQEQAQKQA